MTNTVSCSSRPTTAVRIAQLVTALVVLLAWPTASHAASSVSIGVSTDPRVDTPYTLTVSGASDASRTLYMRTTSLNYCPATAYDAATFGTATYGGTALSSGSFSVPFTDTETGPGPTNVTYCAYLAASPSATPVATAITKFSVRAATASVSLSAPSDPRVDAPYTITVSGTAENNRNLYVRTTSLNYCPATAYDASTFGTATYGGSPIAAGSFTKTFIDTQSGPGPTNVTYCAYVATAPSATPDSTNQIKFSVRAATASLSMIGTDTAQVGVPYGITVNGIAENDRTLFVRWTSLAYCPNTAYDGSTFGTATYAGTPVTAGSFTKVVVDTTTGPGTIACSTARTSLPARGRPPTPSVKCQ